MALIKCSECGKEISDKAIACINCGCPIEKMVQINDIQESGLRPYQKPELKAYQPNYKKSLDEVKVEEEKRKIAEQKKAEEKAIESAKKEHQQRIQEMEREQSEIRKKLKSNQKTINASLGCMALGVIFMFVGMFLGLILFAGIGLTSFATATKNKKIYEARLYKLNEMINGKQEILLCPHCFNKSVVSSTVSVGQVNSGSVTRVSDNINPLHPFTHTNITNTGSTTTNVYGSVYQCTSCGKTFSEPIRKMI